MLAINDVFSFLLLLFPFFPGVIILNWELPIKSVYMVKQPLTAVLVRRTGVGCCFAAVSLTIVAV